MRLVMTQALSVNIRRYAPNVRLLRAAGCSLSVTAEVRAKGSPADVPDNRPLSDRVPTVLPQTEEQLAHGRRERWLVDGDVGPGRSNDDVAVNGNCPYRFG
jgi:hypothetical protein